MSLLPCNSPVGPYDASGEMLALPRREWVRHTLWVAAIRLLEFSRAHLQLWPLESNDKWKKDRKLLFVPIVPLIRLVSMEQPLLLGS